MEWRPPPWRLGPHDSGDEYYDGEDDGGGSSGDWGAWESDWVCGDCGAEERLGFCTNEECFRSKARKEERARRFSSGDEYNGDDDDNDDSGNWTDWSSDSVCAVCGTWYVEKDPANGVPHGFCTNEKCFRSKSKKEESARRKQASRSSSSWSTASWSLPPPPPPPVVLLRPKRSLLRPSPFSYLPPTPKVRPVPRKTAKASISDPAKKETKKEQEVEQKEQHKQHEQHEKLKHEQEVEQEWQPAKKQKIKQEEDEDGVKVMSIEIQVDDNITLSY